MIKFKNGAASGEEQVQVNIFNRIPVYIRKKNCDIIFNKFNKVVIDH